MKKMGKILIGMGIILLGLVVLSLMNSKCPLKARKNLVKQEAQKEIIKDDYIVAVIGGDKVYFLEIQQAAQNLNRFLKDNFESSQDWRLNYIRQYVAMEVLARKAQQQGVDKEKEVVFKLEQARRGILSDKLLGDTLAKIKITDEGIRKYYDDNKTKYQVPEQIKVSYIKVKNKAEGEDGIGKLSKGKSFAALAGKRKVEINEWIVKGMVMPLAGLEGVNSEAINLLFDLGANGTSSVIQGYIFHIDAKEAAKDKPFEEIKPQVESDYGMQLRGKTIDDFIQKAFSEEKAKIYDAEILNNFKAQK